MKVEAKQRIVTGKACVEMTGRVAQDEGAQGFMEQEPGVLELCNNNAFRDELRSIVGDADAKAICEE